jgi:hypothetical protein
MFDFFSPPQPGKFKKITKETYQMPNTVTSPPNEIYRVGVTNDGMTTLTMISTDGYSMTISLSPAACERMIRMIRSTYEQENETVS